jgi:hypothetical protein
MSKTHQATESLNLKKVVEDLFMVLSPKEKEVVIKRFSLNGSPRQTLESIGQKFGVTRERIRQIEKIGLTKLKRTAPNTKLRLISETAFRIISKNGGVITEDSLIEQVLEEISSQDEYDGHAIKLTLVIHPELSRVNHGDITNAYYHTTNVNPKQVDTIRNKSIKVLEKKEDIVTEGKLLSDLALILNNEDNEFSPETIRSAITVDRRLRKVEHGWGLMTWRHVNPKSIRDKSYIVLKKAQKPLHFDEIATRIKAAGFDKKSVTVQAVHNELIRYDRFVLVGRGLYALKEWGYREGTVADIIESILKKKSPLTKQEITANVLKQRHVKKGTISLNLQKNKHFVRVGRALYALDATKK